MLQCSRCDLCRIASTPERNEQKKGIIQYLDFFSNKTNEKTLVLTDVFPPPHLPARSSRGLTFLWSWAEIVRRFESIGVITPIRSHRQRAARNTGMKGEEKKESHFFNECFNLAAVLVQRKASYQRWMASPPPAPPLGSAERSSYSLYMTLKIEVSASPILKPSPPPASAILSNFDP